MAATTVKERRSEATATRVAERRGLIDRENPHYGRMALAMGDQCAPNGHVHEGSNSVRDDLLSTFFFEEVSTLSELEAVIGRLSDEEKALLADPSLYADPTQEELELLGPGFVARVVARAKEKMCTKPRSVHLRRL